MGWQGIVALVAFAAAIFLIAIDAIDLTLAIIVVAGILIAGGVTTSRDRRRLCRRSARDHRVVLWWDGVGRYVRSYRDL